MFAGIFPMWTEWACLPHFGLTAHLAKSVHLAFPFLCLLICAWHRNLFFFVLHLSLVFSFPFSHSSFLSWHGGWGNWFNGFLTRETTCILLPGFSSLILFFTISLFSFTFYSFSLCSLLLSTYPIFFFFKTFGCWHGNLSNLLLFLIELLCFEFTWLVISLDWIASKEFVLWRICCFQYLRDIFSWTCYVECFFLYGKDGASKQEDPFTANLKPINWASVDKTSRLNLPARQYGDFFLVYGSLILALALRILLLPLLLFSPPPSLLLFLLCSFFIVIWITPCS